MRRATEAEKLKLAGQMEAAVLVLRGAPNCACKQTKRNDDGQLERMPACKSKLEHALRVAREAAGFVGSSKSGDHGGDIPNPTLAALFKQYHVDPRTEKGSWEGHRGPEWWQDRMGRDVALISAALADLVVLTAELGTVTSTDPRELTKNGQGSCPVCDVFCSGAVNDRLISGMCDTDYRAWLRAGRPPRYEWIRDRRALRSVAS